MLVWTAFLFLIFIFMAIDLGVFNRKAHIISYKEATKWTALWTTIGLSFSAVIYYIYNQNLLELPVVTKTPVQAAIEYLTGYIVELSLSIDNIFVIAVIFRSFKIPLKYQHRVLFWGILGALLFRGVMILFGVMLIEKFTWTTYLFGGFLIFTAIKMMSGEEETEFNPKDSAIYRFVRKLMPVTGRIEGQQFILRKRGLYIATPLLLALILIEFTDVLFALDSIPAILGITTEPFIVFTSNIFAILGLRSMYFFVANMLDSFHYLKHSLVIILAYVGIKLMMANHYHLPLGLSLGIIVVSIAGGILFSLHYKKHHATGTGH